jgi:PPOX class probable F420-dependent enzyme
MARDMTPAEIHAFLDHGTRTGKLATARANGAPHVAPIWFVRDGDDLVFNTGAGTVKGKALARDNRVALCVDDEQPPFSFVIVEGVAEISDDEDEKLSWATKIGGRYMGAENAEAFGRRNAVPDELLVRLRPTRIIATADLAD